MMRDDAERLAHRTVGHLGRLAGLLGLLLALPRAAWGDSQAGLPAPSAVPPAMADDANAGSPQRGESIYRYRVQDNALLVISGPVEAEHIRATLRLPGPVRDLQQADALLFIRLLPQGLAVVDIRRPRRPVLLRHDADLDVRELTLADGMAHLHLGDGTRRTYSLASPSAPSIGGPVAAAPSSATPPATDNTQPAPPGSDCPTSAPTDWRVTAVADQLRIQNLRSGCDLGLLRLPARARFVSHAQALIIVSLNPRGLLFIDARVPSQPRIVRSLPALEVAEQTVDGDTLVIKRLDGERIAESLPALWTALSLSTEPAPTQATEARAANRPATGAAQGPQPARPVPSAPGAATAAATDRGTELRWVEDRRLPRCPHPDPSTPREPLSPAFARADGPKPDSQAGPRLWAQASPPGSDAESGPGRLTGDLPGDLPGDLVILSGDRSCWHGVLSLIHPIVDAVIHGQSAYLLLQDQRLAFVDVAQPRSPRLRSSVKVGCRLRAGLRVVGSPERLSIPTEAGPPALLRLSVDGQSQDGQTGIDALCQGLTQPAVGQATAPTAPTAATAVPSDGGTAAMVFGGSMLSAVYMLGVIPVGLADAVSCDRPIPNCSHALFALPIVGPWLSLALGNWYGMEGAVVFNGLLQTGALAALVAGVYLNRNAGRRSPPPRAWRIHPSGSGVAFGAAF